MNPSQISHVTATGDITTRDSYLRAVVLAATTDASTVTVRAGGGSGTIVAVLSAAADATASADFHDALCVDGIHVTTTGTTPDVTVVHA